MYEIPVIYYEDEVARLGNPGGLIALFDCWKREFGYVQLKSSAFDVLWDEFSTFCENNRELLYELRGEFYEMINLTHSRDFATSVARCWLRSVLREWDAYGFASIGVRGDYPVLAKLTEQAKLAVPRLTEALEYEPF